ncbi:hypothetical protein TUZN_0419 [Thermoproteus uzoniensis 768-20]|uniref:Nuclease n=1 Tax=Thermoproteus uzoniensis (strain 768-20) TaxID=999630 RepID=F2L2X7_THEU7|nr:DUF790 family protein [Thermoproteus uzoniensis]AEA11915.1 hypothetical protein TUZN_0419 [Thermoproteus uzoniensis 768-20]
MIPLELLRASRRGDQVSPRYLRELWPAEYVLGAYKPGMRLAEARAKVEDAPFEPKLARGLAHIVERTIALEEVDRRLLTKIRLEVFREAAKAYPVVDEEGRRRVVEAVASRLKIPPEAVEAALAKIHEDELVIVRGPDISAEELAALYNTSLIQTLLFRSRRMAAYVVADGARVKELVRALKGLGLMYVAERAGDGIRLDIDGPVSAIKQTERYGTRLAKLVPYVISADDWRIEADIGLYGKVYKFVEAKSSAPRLAHRDIEPPQFDSTAEEEFYRNVSRLCAVQREPEALVVGNRVFIPDFKIGDLYVEIVGFWTPDYIARKYEKLAAAKIPLLVLVDERLALATWKDLPHYVVLYKDRPRLSDVFKYIKPYCARH